MTWTSKYFRPEEVLSPAALLHYKQTGNCVMCPAMLGELDDFREFVGYPLFINHGELRFRGFRSYIENTSIGGAKWSWHMFGKAADISCYKLTLHQLHEAAKDFKWQGIGYYPNNNFIHVDMRFGDKARWTKL